MKFGMLELEQVRAKCKFESKEHMHLGIVGEQLEALPLVEPLGAEEWVLVL